MVTGAWVFGDTNDSYYVIVGIQFASTSYERVLGNSTVRGINTLPLLCLFAPY